MASESDSEVQLQVALDIFQIGTRFTIISTTSITLIYGVYLCLVPITAHLMANNGLKSRARKWLLTITISMFTLSTVDWILSVDYTIQAIGSLNRIVAACYGRDNASACFLDRPVDDVMLPQLLFWTDMFDNILFVNYIISDGIIVWRTWVLCSDQRRVVLMIPVIMLVINTVIYLAIVVGFATSLNFEKIGYFNLSGTLKLHDIQFSLQALSLIINIFATSIIALKAWKYRKFLMESGMGLRTPTKAIRILALLIESGVVYILIGVTSLAFFTTFLRTGGQAMPEIAPILIHVGSQLVGMYPIVVIILVELNRSLDTTFSSFGTVIDVRGDRPSQAEPMTLAPRRVLASGSQIDSGTKPPNTENHVVGIVGIVRFDCAAVGARGCGANMLASSDLVRTSPNLPMSPCRL